MTTDQTARSVHPLEALIDTAFEGRASISPSTAEPALLAALDRVVAELNAGSLRVAQKRDGAWVTNQWIKKAVLLYFRTHDNEVMDAVSALPISSHQSTKSGWTFCRCKS